MTGSLDDHEVYLQFASVTNHEDFVMIRNSDSFHQLSTSLSLSCLLLQILVSVASSYDEAGHFLPC